MDNAKGNGNYHLGFRLLSTLYTKVLDFKYPIPQFYKVFRTTLLEIFKHM